MKRCNALDEQFENVSGSLSAPRSEFHLTIIDNTSLPERLAKELRSLVTQLKQAWPDVKRDPVNFGRRAIFETTQRIRQRLSATNALAAITAAMLVAISAGVILVLSSALSKEKLEGADTAREQSSEVITFLPDPKVDTDDRGIGAGTKGRVGFGEGRGEGSGPQPKKSTGGGGSGQHDPLPTQVGKPPQPSAIPAPIPKFPPVQQQALPVAGIDLDPALWKNLPAAQYGDPRSKSTAPSNGPGDGDGMGTGNGTGIGEGSGGGFGQGQDGNMGGGPKGLGCCGQGGATGNNLEDPDRIYPSPQVSERARVLSKPEPQYTEDARRNLVMGSPTVAAVCQPELAEDHVGHCLLRPWISLAGGLNLLPCLRQNRPVLLFRRQYRDHQCPLSDPVRR